jgi:Spy/CpxP family protein refolding chaperone
MKAKHAGVILVVLAVAGLIAFSTTSYADWGRGGGPGNCPMGGRGGFGGPGIAGNLSDEEIATLQKERSAFVEATRELRDKHYQKELELKAELAKQSPDAKKAAELQKEVSALESELDQKRLEQGLKMKKDHPQIYSKGFGGGRRGGMGMGPGMGRGAGRGACNGGPCWE